MTVVSSTSTTDAARFIRGRLAVSSQARVDRDLRYLPLASGRGEERRGYDRCRRQHARSPPLTSGGRRLFLGFNLPVSEGLRSGADIGDVGVDVAGTAARRPWTLGLF